MRACKLLTKVYKVENTKQAQHLQSEKANIEKLLQTSSAKNWIFIGCDFEIYQQDIQVLQVSLFRNLFSEPSFGNLFMIFVLIKKILEQQTSLNQFFEHYA